MDLQTQLKNRTDEAVLAEIRSYLTLSDYGVFGSHTHAVNVDLLTAAGERLAAAVARITELKAKVEKLEAENAGLALDKLTAPPALDGLTITRNTDERQVDKNWQWYDVRSTGATYHSCCIRVVRRVSGSHRDEPAFALIERRLLAGNPVEA